MPITDADAREADPTSMDTQTKVTCKCGEGLEAGVRRSGIPGWGSGKRFIIGCVALFYIRPLFLKGLLKA